jgi:hypothetical protein
MLPGRDASLSKDADRGAFFSSGASSGALQTRLVCVCVCVSLSVSLSLSLSLSLIAVTSGLAARRIEV